MKTTLMACLLAACAVAQAQSPKVERPPLAAVTSLLGLQDKLALDGRGAPVSLAEAAQTALERSPEVRAARFREESFAETSNAARGALLPHAELRLSRGRGRLESETPALYTHRLDNSVVLSQGVLDEAARHAWTRQELQALSAQEQRIGAESQALLDTGLSWLAVLQARAALELGGEYETLLAELLRYVTERAQAGGASPADRERVSARVANQRSALADNRAQLQAALRSLQRLTQDSPSALRLEGVPTLSVPDDATEALAAAREGNAELRSARLEQRAADSERYERRAAFLPRVAVEVTHARSRNSGGTEAYLRDSKAMIVMTMPLASGGSDWAQLRAAVARQGELEARLEGAERRIQQDIETAYANLRAASERFATVREELEGNRKVVEAFRAQLIGGNRQLLDVLDAYQRLHQSRLDLVQVLVGTAQNEWRVAHLAGRLIAGVRR